MNGDPQLYLALGFAAVAAALALLRAAARRRRQNGRDRHGLREAVRALSRLTADMRADQREVLWLRADRERLAGQLAEARRANDMLLRLAGITVGVAEADFTDQVDPDYDDVPTLTLVAPSTEDEAVTG